MRASARGLAAALASTLLVLGCSAPPVDLKQALQIDVVATGWYDAGIVDGKNKLVPTVSFTVKGQSSTDIAARLAAAGLGVGVGNFYAYRLVQALGIDSEDGAVRVSFVHYTSKDEVDRLMQELDRCLN